MTPTAATLYSWRWVIAYVVVAGTLLACVGYAVYLGATA